MIGQERKRTNRECEVGETLVKCAFTAVKSKAAAVHYENMLAFVFSVGGEVGGSGHSRKMFSDLVNILNRGKVIALFFSNLFKYLNNTHT